MEKLAKKVLQKLNANGFSAYVVGGFVRDHLLGIKSDDIDITTNATPAEVINLFDKVIPTGIEHGTVTVMIDNHAIEITTFRRDLEYKNFRKPEEVMFTNDVKEDLLRRDFTVNSFLMNEELEILDYLSAKQDLNNKIIKTIGNPDDRFTEDALRMLRAVRFVSKLGFVIEKETYKSIKKNAHLLSNVSIERIKMELSKVFLGKYYNKARILLETLKFPKMAYLYPIKAKSLLDFYSILYIDNDLSLTEWKFSNSEKRYIENAKKVIQSDLSLYELYKITNAEVYYDLIEHYHTKEEKKEIEDMLNSLPIRNKKQLKVNGHDIKELGFSGKIVGNIMNNIEQKVVEGIMINDKQILVDYIRRNYED